MLERIPKTVLERIQDQLQTSGGRAHIGWDSGDDEEDTLTGDLGAVLRDGVSGVLEDGERKWSWKVTYKKFRGRGPGADEKPLGADGILEIQLTDSSDGRVLKKGLLFQSLKIGSKTNKALSGQVQKMEAIVPNGSAIFEYGPDQYSAWPGAEHRDLRTSVRRPIGEFLGRRFLPCEVGKLGLFYDPIRRALIVPEENNGVIFVKGEIGERIRVEVRVET
jgi:hypothetical protein